MKASRSTSTAILVLLLGFVAPAWAGQERPAEGQDHPKQENTHQQAKPSQQQEQQKRQVPQKQHTAISRQEEHTRQRRSDVPAQNSSAQHVQQGAWQQHRAQNWQSEHRTWQQRGGYSGYRIPDDRFRGKFGRDHAFRIQGLPFMVVGGYPRFQYGGYWLSVVDPWPADWADGWYDSDDVFVDYVGNGYYLYNRSHPGAGIAVSISM